MFLTLRIQKREQNEAMVLLVLAITLCFGFFFDLLNLPSALKYTVDIVWLVLFATIIINRFRMPNAETSKLLALVIVFWVSTLAGCLLNLQSPLYYLWGFRNNFRFFVFFFACSMFLKEQTVTEVLDGLDKLFYLNFIVSLFQFFVLNIKKDNLGGIFGTDAGCNGKTIVFFSIILSRSILGYIDDREKVSVCLLKCCMAVLIAAMAELKFFFVLFVFIVAMATVTTKTSIKKIWIIIAAGIGVYVGIVLLLFIFPGWKGFFSIENILASLLSESGYTGQGDMNRLTAIPIAWTRFMNDWTTRLLGLGLGNCDTSAFSFLNTPFFEKYGYLHYSWFSSTFMFLETGVIGLVLYSSFFVFVYMYARRREKNKKGIRELCQMTQILSVFCLILAMYNASLRAEEAYMMYFALALPFIKSRNVSLKAGDAT